MNAMLADAAILMAIGMATVFTFLIVLTACVTLLTQLTADPTLAASPREAPATKQPDAAQLAAISSAITQYRKSR